MWTWDQSAGTMSRDGVVQGRGYAGNGLGKNNPDDQDEVGVGPVPRGLWFIGAPHDSQNTGVYTMPLTPALGTDTCGRSGFRIHGDSLNHPGDASHGCIVLSRPMREIIWNSGDHELTVIA